MAGAGCLVSYASHVCSKQQTLEYVFRANFSESVEIFSLCRTHETMTHATCHMTHRTAFRVCAERSELCWV